MRIKSAITSRPAPPGCAGLGLRAEPAFTPRRTDPCLIVELLSRQVIDAPGLGNIVLDIASDARRLRDGSTCGAMVRRSCKSSGPDPERADRGGLFGIDVIERVIAMGRGDALPNKTVRNVPLSVETTCDNAVVSVTIQGGAERPAAFKPGLSLFCGPLPAGPRRAVHVSAGLVDLGPSIPQSRAFTAPTVRLYTAANRILPEKPSAVSGMAESRRKTIGEQDLDMARYQRALATAHDGNRIANRATSL